MTNGTTNPETGSKLKITLGYIPDNCTEELAVEISDFSITYCQQADTCSEKDDYQMLKITARNSGSGEDGWYYDLDTCGTHWSVDDDETIALLIKDFQKRMTLNVIKQADLKRFKRKEE